MSKFLDFLLAAIIVLVFAVLICVFAIIFRPVHDEYDDCYEDMQDRNVATFGCCSGFTGDTDMCQDCPYFKNTKEEDDK